jgi:hypothetical protein
MFSVLIHPVTLSALIIDHPSGNACEITIVCLFNLPNTSEFSSASLYTLATLIFTEPPSTILPIGFCFEVY